MANTTNPSQQSCTSPSDHESSHVQDSTSSRPVSITPALKGAPKATRLTLKEYTAKKKQQAATPKASITLKEYTARKKQQAAAPQASTHKSAHITIPPFDTDDHLVQHYDASIERCPRCSLLFHRKNKRLESASRTAARTSTPRSTVKDEVLLSATATATPITASASALENYARLLNPTKTPNRILKNDMLVPTRRETSTRTLEIEDDVLMPATTITTQVVISDSPHFLFRLPREIRDYIYAYLAPDEAFWIARPRVIGKQRNAVVERASMHKSAALIKCKHSLIFASRDTRDEFRCALWRDYVDSDRQVPLRVYDFDPKPVRDLFTGCSILELPKVLNKGRYRVSMYLTGDLRRFRKVAQLDPRSLIQTLIMRWVDFCVTRMV
jgi:hypothetical protein